MTTTFTKKKRQSFSMKTLFYQFALLSPHTFYHLMNNSHQLWDFLKSYHNLLSQSYSRASAPILSLKKLTWTILPIILLLLCRNKCGEVLALSFPKSLPPTIKAFWKQAKAGAGIQTCFNTLPSNQRLHRFYTFYCFKFSQSLVFHRHMIPDNYK